MCTRSSIGFPSFFEQLLQKGSSVSVTSTFGPGFASNCPSFSRTTAPRGRRCAKKIPQRSSELVRVTDLNVEDQRYFRDVVRKTRMLYDSIRILSVAEEEKRARGSGDEPEAICEPLRCSGIVGCGSKRQRIVGSIPGVYVGDIFFFRMGCVWLDYMAKSKLGLTIFRRAKLEP
ncbi:histone-lysine N-methyltransferase family member SUVH9 [Prunus yedoensis var. nudiflora]|uniref:Histone-lysine N-methyltransferase family member SUVH9 n=1 Tax=Prunus yedoensis var. nudiflora TaxID=2094558 RepID=A0A314Y2H0_PRUYE|nr:histone-lysine N-methyltransferase family member SUVH9 [Prunus yedoensis var. nudiflora]